jgi:hypothetical protein
LRFKEIRCLKSIKLQLNYNAQVENLLLHE